MRNLFSLLLVTVLVPVGAGALAAQQPTGDATAKTTQTPQHTRNHHRRRHAATRHAPGVRRTMAVVNPNPRLLGTPAAGFPEAPHAATMERMGANPSGGRLQRLSSGLITPNAARAIALRTIPNGTSVNKIRLRTEDGRQVYDVKVVTPNQTGNEMVRVDAHTGAVLETKNVDNPVGAVKGTFKKAVNKVKHP